MYQTDEAVFIFPPKTGSTSAVRMLRDAYRHYGKEDWFQLYDFRQAFHKGPQFPDRPYKVCVTREPVDRFMSFWRSEESAYARKTVDSIEAFFDAPELMEHEGTRIHTLPLTYWLGTDKSYFTHIFTTDQLGELPDLLNEIYGYRPEFVYKNKSKRTQLPTKREIALIQDWAKSDYEVFYDLN